VDGTSGFEDLFRAEYPTVVRVLAPIVGSLGDAEAVAQEAFLKAYVRWGRVGRYDRPGAWVQKVAVRDGVRVARKLARSSPGEPPSEHGRWSEVSDVAGRTDLWRALSRLPARQRACVVLHHLADWPAARVAEALGCREATVRVHLHRGRAALAAELAPDRRETPDGRR
jgi:RNA polymerase sigma-70 factor (ECF subfamily)